MIIVAPHKGDPPVFKPLGALLLYLAAGLLIAGIGSFIQKKIAVKESARAAKQLAEEKRQHEERVRREAEERAKQEDRKYDQIINCPLCNGEGQCTVTEYVDRLDDGRWRTDRWIGTSSDGYISADSMDKSVRERTEPCPGCNGQGTAYAYFEPGRRETCKNCNGTGRMTMERFVKKEIGAERKNEEVPCNKCRGQGYNAMDVVHIKTLQEPELGRFFDDEPDEKKRQMRAASQFTVVLTEDNRPFYSKHKPRF